MAVPTFAQQSSSPAPEKSLTEIAKETKQKKSTKKVLTEEDIDPISPLPSINFEGVDNSDEIIAAIGAYKENHTADETEQAVHDWYDKYDELLAAAIRDTTEARDRRNSTLFTGFQLCQNTTDYQKCELKRQAEMRAVHHDQLVNQDDFVTIARVQQAFIKIRGGIGRYNLNYIWFKVRNGNGVGSF